ncbi:hypothetical protein LUZ60_016808 [Juncus effusus]|nr:hypothetical protein LUZ60_016808 [Juncus effusus]
MAAIVEAFITRLTDRFFTLLHDNTIMFSKVRSEIEGLNATFHNIKNVLIETEMRKIDDRAINMWRLHLKDVMYDIDDMLDEYHIWDKKKCLSSEVFFRFPLNIRKIIFYIQIGTKIREINSRLSAISAKRTQFNFKIDCNLTPPPISRKRSYIAAFNKASLVVIEESTDKLVEVLTKEDIFAKSIIRGIGNEIVYDFVYAIVGIGGIGKTTLAQKIYNDERITAGFGMKLWVSVTQHFTDIDVLWYIITTLGINAPASYDRNVLEAIVKEALAGKMIFIVLDDVWDEQIWYGLFYELLYVCVKGSRVLITTRKEGVARQMKAIHIHRVELMPPEDGWKLLCKEVTLTGEKEVEDLKDVGLRIINKCGGLPLAIKAIGGVLRYKEKRRREWVAVLESASWSKSGLPEGVQAALYLSYKDLPSHLKECFLYTCMFPWIPFYSRLYLIQFWIAEGFIIGDNGRESESVGEDYYAELMHRGLLQSNPLSYDCATCTVHELLQLLAQFLVREESLILPHAHHIIENVSEGSSSSVLMKLRRLCTRVSEGEIF